MMFKREPARLNFKVIGHRYDSVIREVETLLSDNTIEPKLRELVKIRAAQLNGVLYHVDKHVKIAQELGESERRLHHLSIWKDSSLFNERERAALQWTEWLTELHGHSISRKDYDYIKDFFSEDELVDLTFIIATANSRHRLAAAFLPEIAD